MSDHDQTVTLEEWVNAASAAAVEAIRSDDSERRMAVARSIDDVRAQFPAELDDLSHYLDALNALLEGADRTAAAELVGDAYASAFDRVVGAIDAPEEPDHWQHEYHTHAPAKPQGQPLGLGEVLQHITTDARHVMRSGSDAERARMAQGLEVLRFQAAGALEWPELAEFLAALQDFLRTGGGREETFGPPFDQAWAQIVAAQSEGADRAKHGRSEVD
jgi:hypothetical protein